MSVLIKDVLSDISLIYHLNVAVALAVIIALQQQNISDLSIKWPNDIMAGNKKIGGILIENSIKPDGEIHSIVGLGLNVNQKNFENLPKASSLALVAGRDFDKEMLLFEIIDCMKTNIRQLTENPDLLWQSYTGHLFKKGVPMPFENQAGERFMGIIQGVTPEGKVEILHENDAIVTFGIKEIQMLY
jgi:BirA family biotin operon repressor/biotin-[acetyl-CoA-carboxylase] ligase